MEEGHRRVRVPQTLFLLAGQLADFEEAEEQLAALREQVDQRCRTPLPGSFVTQPPPVLGELPGGPAPTGLLALLQRLRSIPVTTSPDCLSNDFLSQLGGGDSLFVFF